MLDAAPPRCDNAIGEVQHAEADLCRPSLVERRGGGRVTRDRDAAQAWVESHRTAVRTPSQPPTRGLRGCLACSISCHGRYGSVSAHRMIFGFHLMNVSVIDLYWAVIQSAERATLATRTSSMIPSK